MQLEWTGSWIESCDDGPGVRTVIFLQGCSKCCKGCHNESAKIKGMGKTEQVDFFVNFLEKVCENKKVTISGGEPLEQMEALLELVEKLKGLGYNICVYSGWDLKMVPDSIFRYIDYIKVGEYISSLRDEDIQFYGSSNQRMYQVVNGRLTEYRHTA